MIMQRKQMTYVLVGYLRVDIDLVRVIEINEDLFGKKVATFEWTGWSDNQGYTRRIHNETILPRRQRDDIPRRQQRDCATVGAV